MKVFIVDDEWLALQVIESKLSQFDCLDVIASFQDVNEAIEQMKLQQPDVVFLDINMPGTNGLLAADQMLEHSPETHIVFVTAYDQYAIQAFELHALDYILKPVSFERIQKTINRLHKIKKYNPSNESSAAPSVQIRCFRSFSLRLADKEPITWRTNKAKELFSYLLHHRHAVSKDQILDALWQEDVDIKKAHNQLYTTIYLIRQALQHYKEQIRLISRNGGTYELICEQVAIDYVDWESALQTAPPLTEDTLKHHLELFEKYEGDYLAEEGYLWAENERERLRILWFDHALGLGEQIILSKQYNTAIRLYLKLLDNFPLSEKVYLSLMKVYALMGDRGAVERYYDELITMLDEEFGMPPQAKTTEWYVHYTSEFK